MTLHRTEKDDALALANRLLDEPSRDPDDHLSMLARQLLRAEERARTAEHAGLVFTALTAWRNVSDEVREMIDDDEPRLADALEALAKAVEVTERVPA